jgi:sugar/nucleoside kinase (ribokinase family)
VSEVVCYGELGVDNIILVPHAPTPERAAFPTAETYRVGGAAANTAVWLAGWGVRVALSGNAIGEDEYGRRLLLWLRRFPTLDIEPVERRAGVVTPFCRITVTPDAERSILVYWYPRTPKTPLRRELLDGARFLALDLYGGEERLAAARMAKDAGVTTVVSDAVSPDHPVMPFVGIAANSAAYVRECFPGEDVREHARALHAASGGIIVTTNGPNPVHALDVDGREFFVRPPAISAVDATGAGDVFRAGLLYGLLEGWPLERCVCWAAAAGALKAQRLEGHEVPAPDVVELLAAAVRPE